MKNKYEKPKGSGGKFGSGKQGDNRGDDQKVRHSSHQADSFPTSPKPVFVHLGILIVGLIILCLTMNTLCTGPT